MEKSEIFQQIERSIEQQLPPGVTMADYKEWVHFQMSSGIKKAIMQSIQEDAPNGCKNITINIGRILPDNIIQSTLAGHQG